MPRPSFLGGEGDRGARALGALLEVTRKMNSEVDLDDLLETIVRHASTVVEADRTTIFIYDHDRSSLWSRVAQGLTSGTIELQMGSGIAGDVARTLQLTNVVDAYADPRFNREVDSRTGYHTRSILCAPIIDSSGRLLGVIQSVNKVTADRFDEYDESLMGALASHVAVAIERAQLTEMHVEKERLEQSLQLAHDIQMRMLPAGEVELPPGARFAIRAYIRPARHVGGDLYDFSWDDDRLYFCIADVSGKGVGAALVMAVTKTLFRANASHEDDPSMVMTRVNERLYEETDPTMFVTAFCGFLDLTTGRLRFANAGHDRPLILSGDAAARPLQSKPGIALGVLPKFRYVMEEITLLPGQSIYLYTDGVSEATNAAEELFSLPRVMESLSGLTDPQRVISTLLGDVDRFVQAAPQADDITMMCVQFKGGRSASSSFRREIAALDEVFALIDRFVSDNDIDPKLRYPIDFSVEEVFTNLVKYNPRGREHIAIRIALEEDTVKIDVVDPDCDSFDVNLDAPAVDTDRPLHQRQPGGLGLHLIKKMMDRVEYKHENRAGTITLYKRLG